jgi:hypothetical protein
LVCDLGPDADENRFVLTNEFLNLAKLVTCKASIAFQFYGVEP